MTSDWQFADDLGPEKILHIYEPSLGLKAVVVVDNVAAGPSIGGLRVAQDVSTEECFRLARAMTLKNAAASLPHGGGKAVLVADPAGPRKEKLVRAFATAVRDIVDYIPGPDMGTNEEAMAWVQKEIGRAVGLPRELGGIPLDEIGATGYGLSVAARIAKDYCRLDLKGARVAIQGFGSVGRHAARYLAEAGAILVAAADSRGTVEDQDGLSIEALCKLKQSGKSLKDAEGGRLGDRDDIISVDCDIWIPAARPDVITGENADKVKARLILEGANIPITAEAEEALHARGVLCVPDFIANAGGVVCASVEYRGGGESSAFQIIEEKIAKNTQTVLEESARSGQSPRRTAVNIARKRVLKAMTYRRWH